MKLRTDKQESRVIVYDADSLEQPGPELFDPAYWEEQDGLSGTARGRGSAFMLETGFGAAVLKQYLRGGWPARFIRDRYFFTGYLRSRPLAEMSVLAHVHELGLPAPAPLAAMCERAGLLYRGWLMTRRISGVTPLSDLLAEPGAGLWERTGAAIRRFHDARVAHADLNARNILVDESGSVHLVDFDRARVNVRDMRVLQANLRRLRRSLEKLWPERSAAALDRAWSALMAGYGKPEVAS
ncbi:MAG: 3-deoxy-D-manno-octulosonic acid kinase [Lysobacterales bacterium]